MSDLPRLWKAGGSGLFLNYRFAQPVRTLVPPMP